MEDILPCLYEDMHKVPINLPGVRQLICLIHEALLALGDLTELVQTVESVKGIGSAGRAWTFKAVWNGTNRQIYLPNFDVVSKWLINENAYNMKTGDARKKQEDFAAKFVTGTAMLENPEAAKKAPNIQKWG